MATPQSSSVDVYVGFALERFSNATAPDDSGSYNYYRLIALCIYLAIIIGFLNLLIASLRKLGKFVLYLLGFRQGGVKRDSPASRYQSKNYGGHVPEDSHFARLQSHGAEDEGGSLAAIIGSWTLLAGYVLGRARGWWN